MSERFTALEMTQQAMPEISNNIALYLRYPIAADAVALAWLRNDWDMWHGDDQFDVHIHEEEGKTHLFVYPVSRRADDRLVTDTQTILAWTLLFDHFPPDAPFSLPDNLPDNLRTGPRRTPGLWEQPDTDTPQRPPPDDLHPLPEAV